jgi:diguanylate cyclase (GGDEF)-like protein/PAS domain S-box-containing protein
MIGISNRPNGYTQEIVDDLYFLMNFLGFLIKSYQNDRKRKFIESKLQIQSKELNEANDLLRAVYESNRDIQFLLDIDGVIINYQVHDNKDLYLTPEEFIGKKLHDVLPIQVAEQFKNAFDEAISSNSLVSFDYILPMPSGDCTYNARIISLKDKRIVVTARDITESKQLLVELEAVKEYYSLLLDASPSGIWHTKTNGDNIYVSPKWTEITGVSAVDAKGTGWSDSIHAEDKERVYLDWVVATENEMAYQSEFRFVRPDGIIKWVVSVGSPEKRNNKVVSWIGTITDITPIKAYQGQLEHIAHYDVLTNLPNRVLLADRLNHAILQCQRRNQSLAVAFMDLDGFKVVNDTYGHDLGDKLLVELSKRMKEALREGDTLARIGGDEFIAIMVDLDDTDDKEPVLERLLKVAAEPITLGDSVVQVSLSIGVTLYPQDGADADQLMRHADQAMYVAKQAGKNQYQLFDAAQDSGVNIRRQNIADVDSALDRLEFVLHYQPKVNMHTSEVIGVEALIRWQHPVRGLVPPLDFLPAIDGHAISLELGEWVIDTALSQINQWRSMGVELPISVNISAYQLQQRNFSNRLALLLAAHTEVDPNYLELEILESSELSDISQVFDTMSACHDLGVRFALDDFGTGYSSLTHIKRLPAYLIKIDQSFVRDMLEDLDDLAIIESVIGLAKTFKREVIAEGVETIEQGVALLKLGCELAQGYGIARPMTAGDIPEWISNWKADDSWQAHNLIETN